MTSISASILPSWTEIFKLLHKTSFPHLRRRSSLCQLRTMSSASCAAFVQSWPSPSLRPDCCHVLHLLPIGPAPSQCIYTGTLPLSHSCARRSCLHVLSVPLHLTFSGMVDLWVVFCLLNWNCLLIALNSQWWSCLLIKCVNCFQLSVVSPVPLSWFFTFRFAGLDYTNCLLH